MGQEKHPAGVVRGLFRSVSWLCHYQKRGSNCLLVRLQRIVSGNIPVGRKSVAADFVPEPLGARAVGWYSAVVGLLELVASVGLLFIPGKRNRSAVYA